MKKIITKIFISLFFIVFIFVAYISVSGKGLSDKTMSWLFFLVPVFLLLGFVFSIVYVIVYTIKRNKDFKKIAKLHSDWEYYKTINELDKNSQFFKYLDVSLYNIAASERKVNTDIIHGNFNDMEFWFSFYKSYNTAYRSQKASIFNIFIVPTENISQELIIFHKTSVMKLFMVDKLSKLIGKPLTTPQQKRCEWMMVTDTEAFKNLNLNISDLDKLKAAMENAHSLLLYKGFFIYAIDYNTTISLEKIEDFLPKVQYVKNILNK